VAEETAAPRSADTPDATVMSPLGRWVVLSHSPTAEFGQKQPVAGVARIFPKADA